MPAHIVETIKRLEAEGFSAYAVGGCVRDTLRGETPHDWDVTTSAVPSQIKSVFSELRHYDVGIEHGTVGLLYPEGRVEVTTFRKDGVYHDARHPDKVGFIDSIEEDLARRDFTMNAIAYNPKKGYVDPFEGRTALHEAKIVSVGDADERLNEDALRIMRALRFSASLGFEIDARLAESLHANAPLLKKVAPERISSELLMLLVGDRVLPVLMEFPDVLAVVIPEIAPTIGHEQKSPYHSYDIWEHTARAVAAAKPDALVRLTLLFHDLGKPKAFFTDEAGVGHFFGHADIGERIARERLKALRFDSATIETVANAIRYHQAAFEPKTMRKWLARLGEPIVRLLLEVKRGDLFAHTPGIAEKTLGTIDECEKAVDELIEQEACFSLKDLAVGGEDIMELGIPEGPEIGRILALLLDEVVEGVLGNTRQELMERAESI